MSGPDGIPADDLAVGELARDELARRNVSMGCFL